MLVGIETLAPGLFTESSSQGGKDDQDAWKKFTNKQWSEEEIFRIRAIHVFYKIFLEQAEILMDREGKRFDYLMEHPEKASDDENKILLTVRLFHHAFLENDKNVL